MVAATLPVMGPPAAILQLVLPRPPTWEEELFFATADQVFALPAVPYAVLSVIIFNSANPLKTLLNKLECTTLESLVMVTLVSDEDPDWITLLKNPRHFHVDSLLHPTALDGLLYGFSGLNT